MKRPSKKKAVVEYRRARHSIKETAEHFCITPQTVKQYCRGENIGYANGRGSNETLEEREERARDLIESRWPQWKYIGGYTGSDDKVLIECRKCGSLVAKSMISFRHYAYAKPCPYCSSAYVRFTLRIDTFMCHWEAEEKERIRRANSRGRHVERYFEPHNCQVCGKVTTRKKYCSKQCSHKALNALTEVRKRRFMKTKVVDKDITLHKLYERDNGICWICGLMCNYGDYVRTDKAFIAGNMYPSIDHIIPRCRGGEHSWTNIKLAHRKCNTARYFKEDGIQGKTSSVLPVA